MYYSPLRIYNNGGQYWYQFDADCWGAQHGCTFHFYTLRGNTYSNVEYMDDCSPVLELGPLLHGPAPREWADTCDFGYTSDVGYFSSLDHYPA